MPHTSNNYCLLFTTVACCFSYRPFASLPSSKNFNMEMEYDFKIMLIGDCGVGKTSIVRRYTDDTFVLGGQMPTVGVDFGRRTLKIDGSVIKVLYPVHCK